MASFDETPPRNSKNGEKIFKTKCAQCHTIDKAYTIEECGRKIGLMAQILLHGTLHATVYEVDKLKIGGGNFLTKMDSKMAIVIVALFAVLLFISPEVACRDFKEELGEVVKETNEESDARLAGSGGGDLDLSYCLPTPMGGYDILKDYKKWIGNCSCGCCQWTTEPEVCLYCCPERHVPDRPSRPRAY